MDDSNARHINWTPQIDPNERIKNLEERVARLEGKHVHPSGAPKYDVYRWTTLELAEGRCPQDPDGLHNYSGTICVLCGATDQKYNALDVTGEYPIVVSDGEDHDLFRRE